MRCKAALFKETGFVFTLNAVSADNYGGPPIHNTVVKADSLVGQEIQQALKAAFDKIRAERQNEAGWHPKNDGLVQDLVDPSTYPFVYCTFPSKSRTCLLSLAHDIPAASTKFIQDEVVGVVDAVEKWSGKGEVVPKPEIDPPIPSGQRSSDGGGGIDRAYWSQTYQWLAANLAFRDDGTVHFTSYINNLHPKKHPEIYGLVEKLVDIAIPAWERVLANNPPLDESGQPQKRFGLPAPLLE